MAAASSSFPAVDPLMATIPSSAKRAWQQPFPHFGLGSGRKSGPLADLPQLLVIDANDPDRRVVAYTADPFIR
jgi:hypothetical protein